MAGELDDSHSVVRRMQRWNGMENHLHRMLHEPGGRGRRREAQTDLTLTLSLAKLFHLESPYLLTGLTHSAFRWHSFECSFRLSTAFLCSSPFIRAEGVRSCQARFCWRISLEMSMSADSAMQWRNSNMFYWYLEKNISLWQFGLMWMLSL